MANHSASVPDCTIASRSAGAAVDLAVLQTVAYADIFDYPLTAAEVHRYLVGLAAPPPAVGRRLAALAATGGLLGRDGYFTLPGRGALVEVRRRRARTAARLWPDGIRYGRMLAQLPFVRMVAITGSLALDNVETAGDIDYLIVTTAGRVWIGRGLANLIRRRTWRSGVHLCPNYVLSEHALTIEDRNLYTAHELIQMVPVAGHAVYRRMLQLNGWTADYLPNFPGAPSRAIADPARRRRISRLAEAVLSTPLGAWLDRLEHARVARKMVPRAKSLAEVAYTGDCCKDHHHAHGQRILEAFAERFDQARKGYE